MTQDEYGRVYWDDSPGAAQRGRQWYVLLFDGTRMMEPQANRTGGRSRQDQAPREAKYDACVHTFKRANDAEIALAKAFKKWEEKQNG